MYPTLDGYWNFFSVGGDLGWNQVIKWIGRCHVFVVFIVAEGKKIREVSIGCVFSFFGAVIGLFSQDGGWG